MTDGKMLKLSDLTPYWIKLLPLIEGKAKGDAIHDDAVRSTTGIKDPSRLDGRMKTYFLRKCMETERRGQEFRVLTDQEQHARTILRKKESRRKAKVALRSAATIDDTKLSNEQRAVRELTIRQLAARLEKEREEEREVKAVLGAPPPLPRLQAVVKG